MELSFLEIVHETPLPKFQVVVRFMSGDADAYDTSESNFETEQEVLIYLHEIQTFKKYQTDRDFDVAAIAAALVWPADEVQEYVWDMFPRDVTCDEYLAKICDIEIFAYFQNNKIKLQVKP